MIPFATGSTPASPLNTVAAPPMARGPGGEAPMFATALPASPLTAIDAVDLMPCNHPQTREVWAAARGKRGNAGVAGPLVADLVRFRPGDPFRVPNAGLHPQLRPPSTLSWLLYDFGQRSASIENEQLLQAAAATQDATVQTLFLGALHGATMAQATRCGSEWRKCTETSPSARPAPESFQAAEARYQRRRRQPADRLQAQTAAFAGDAEPHLAEGEARWQCAFPRWPTPGFTPTSCRLADRRPLPTANPPFQKRWRCA